MHFVFPDTKCCTLLCTCARGCIYSCCTPDDGCKKHPKHVE